MVDAKHLLDNAFLANALHSNVDVVACPELLVVSRLGRNALAACPGLSALGNAAAMVAHLAAPGVVVLPLRAVPFVRVTVIVGAGARLGLRNESVLVVPAAGLRQLRYAFGELAISVLARVCGLPSFWSSFLAAWSATAGLRPLAMHFR